MTSMPIMMYAIFDFEYYKDEEAEKKQSGVKTGDHYLLTNPSLYKIGLNKECLNNKLFAQWIIYGLVQSYMIYYVCYEAMNSVEFNDGEGRDYGFWLCGHISFTLAVIIANIIILMKSNMHNRWTFLV
jgi:magnesium-transporting ATPase (P-type)